MALLQCELKTKCKLIFLIGFHMTTFLQHTETLSFHNLISSLLGQAHNNTYLVKNSFHIFRYLTCRQTQSGEVNVQLSKLDKLKQNSTSVVDVLKCRCYEFTWIPRALSLCWTDRRQTAHALRCWMCQWRRRLCTSDSLAAGSQWCRTWCELCPPRGRSCSPAQHPAARNLLQQQQLPASTSSASMCRVR